jgi:hypothetical protein
LPQHSSEPVIVERRGEDSGQVVLVERPRRELDVSEEIRLLENERRLLQIERLPEHFGSVDIIKDKVIRRSDGETDEVIEVKKDRKGWSDLPSYIITKLTCVEIAGDSRLIRAMMATLT